MASLCFNIEICVNLSFLVKYSTDFVLCGSYFRFHVNCRRHYGIVTIVVNRLAILLRPAHQTDAVRTQDQHEATDHVQAEITNNSNL